MITVAAAFQIIQQNVLTLPKEEVPLHQACGRVLREFIYADRDFPPFNRVTMDGIAISLAGLEAGKDTFLIEDVQFAGEAPKTLQNRANCLEVMTGAVLPNSTDTVIRYEDLHITEDNGKRYAQVIAGKPETLQNIHQQGSDQKFGDLLISEGTLISPAEVAVLATVGKEMVQVTRYPRVAIISTGDELVPVTDQPLPHQIRQSNGYMLQAALGELGIEAERFHLRDDKTSLLTQIQVILNQFDVLLLSGGVSKGKADFIPDVLTELGVQKLFHEVAQRPGKPFWFGRLTTGPVVFALPGNPVSTFVCYYKYVKPWLRACLGASPAHIPLVALAEQVTFKPDLTYFLPVKIEAKPSGAYAVRPLTTGGSGDFAALLTADGFLELPRKTSVFSVHEAFPFLAFRS